MTLKSGWKTYAGCAVLIGLGVAQAFGVQIPDAVYAVVAGLTGIGGRMAIANNAKAAALAAEALAASVGATIKAADKPVA